MKTYIVHHTNQGTPESGEIHGVYATEELAIAAMEAELHDGYDGVTLQENEEEDFIYMYITEHDLVTK